jgi:hypothetical protein
MSGLNIPARRVEAALAERAPDAVIVAAAERHPVSVKAGVLWALIVGCSLMSAYHERIFWLWSGRGQIAALLLTLCFVGYNAISLRLWRANRTWYMAAIGIAVMVFTMSATALASFQLQERATMANADMSAFDRRAEILEKQAADEQAAVDAAVKEEQKWEKVSWERADAARKAETDARARLAGVRANQSALEAERQAAQAGKTDGVWAYLAKFLGADTALLQLLVQIIPALFLDLLPPVLTDYLNRQEAGNGK